MRECVCVCIVGVIGSVYGVSTLNQFINQLIDQSINGPARWPAPRRALHYKLKARTAETARRECNEAEYGRRDRCARPIRLEPQGHLGVCVGARVTIAR